MHSYFDTLASIMASIANKLFNSLLLMVIAQYTRDDLVLETRGIFIGALMVVITDAYPGTRSTNT
jgi:hypothetical protein